MPAATADKTDRRGVPLSVRIRKDLFVRLTARAAIDETSMTATVERMLDLAFNEDERFGGGAFVALFMAFADIARSQSLFAGLSEAEFLAGKWQQNPKLVDRIADNYAALTRRMVDPDAVAAEGDQ